jgi:hypothetical protein
MRHKYIVHSLIVLAVLLAILLFAPTKALAHCDTMDGPVVKAAQRALATRNKALQDGSVEPLLKLFPSTATADIQVRFRDAIARKSFNENDVEAGREYVKAYVSFLHYLEHLYEEKRSVSE